jgi:ankyrin repeat protein
MRSAQNSKNPEIILALLTAGADAKLKTKDGKTAFDFAGKNGALVNTRAYWELNNKRF